MRGPAYRLVGLSLLVVCAAVRLSAADVNVLDQVRTQFNRDKGELRLVVLVSPTCPECVGGAGWIEDYVLKRYPKLPIKVYAVWFDMYPGDSPAAFPAAQKMLPDRRVTHWWDDSKNVGRWFYPVVPTSTKGEIQWDAFYLYGEQATWGNQPDDQRPSPLLTWGRTILTDRKRLTDKIAEIAGPPTASAVKLPVPPATQ